MHRISLEPQECLPSLEFGRTIIKLKSGQAGKSHGNSNTPRSPEEHFLNTIGGKLAEAGFDHWYHSLTGIHTPPDYNIYPDLKHSDNGTDISAVEKGGIRHPFRRKIDIKASKSNSRWLLVDDPRLTADAYILVKLHLAGGSLDEMMVKVSKVGITMDIAGFSCRNDFQTVGVGRGVIFREGDYLPNPETGRNMVKLIAPLNYGICDTRLRNSRAEWNILHKWILKHSHLDSPCVGSVSSTYASTLTMLPKIFI